MRTVSTAQLFLFQVVVLLPSIFKPSGENGSSIAESPHRCENDCKTGSKFSMPSMSFVLLVELQEMTVNNKKSKKIP